jgi:hypothetical protein
LAETRDHSRKNYSGKASGRRLDIEICYPGKALIIIEIKVVEAEEADTKKQREYYSWLQLQPFKWKFPVMVAVAGMQPKYEGFDLQTWKNICIRLRRDTLREEMAKDVVCVAMILAFVGAVEQNILNLPRGKQPGARYPSVNWMEAANHIEEWLTEPTDMNKPKKSDEQANQPQARMIQEGLKSYGHALVALDQFAQLIHKDCNKIIEGRLSELQKASTKLNLRVGDVWDAVERFVADGAWVTSSLSLAPGDWLYIYCGLNWRKEENFKPYVVAGIQIYKVSISASQKERVVNTLGRLLPKRKPTNAEPFAEFDNFGFRGIVQNQNRAEIFKQVASLFAACAAVLRDAGGVRGLLGK